LPWGKRLSAAQLQAEKELAAAEAAYRRIRLETISSLQNAYIEILRAQSLRGVAEQTLQQAERQLEEARIRAEAGDAPQLDVIRSQVPVSNAQAGLLAAQNRETLARRSLYTLLRITPETPPSLTEFPSPALPPFSLEEAEQRAEAHAPEMEEATANFQAAEAALALAQHSREPTYELQASDVRSSDKTGFSRQDTLMFTVTLPLSDGGAARAQVQEKQANLAGVRFALETAQQTVRVAVDAAYLNVSTLLRQMTAHQEAARVAATSVDLTREGYLAGLYSVRDVLDAQATLNQARNDLTQTTYDAQAALVSLYRAMGEEMP
jgi:outer membrane protein TolC